jgi:hypothetical protein
MNTRVLHLSIICLLVISGCGGAPAVVGSRSGGAPGGEAFLANRLDELGYSDKTEIRRLSNFRLNGWSYVDSYHVLINSGPSRNYLIRLRRQCHDLRQATSIGFETTLGSISRGDTLVIQDFGDRLQDCWVDSVFELTKKPKEQEPED